MKPIKALLKAKLFPNPLASIAVFSVSGLSIWTGYAACSIYFYSHHLKAERSQAAIVLGAAVWGEEPSPVFRERINHAIDLYHNDRVEHIIFTGARGEVHEPAEATVGKAYAIARGVPENRIFIETRSRTTFQNLYYAKQEADRHQLTDFLIVSDPLHMKRAMLMAEDLRMKAEASPTPTTRYQSLESQLDFLKRETLFYSLYLARRLVESPVDNFNTF